MDHSLTEWLTQLGNWASPDTTTGMLCASTQSQEQSDVLGSNRLLHAVERSAMACEFEVLLNLDQYPHGIELATDALDTIGRIEQLLSVYLPRSEFSTINRFAAQRPIPVSTETLEVIRLSQDIHAATEGAFDLTAGSLSEAWGFSRRAGRMPAPKEIQSALQLVGSRHIGIDEQGCVSLAISGVRLNSGGIGKGYALDRAAWRLSRAGINDFLIHGGQSSIIARGDRLNGLPGGGWLVALKHPLRGDDSLGTIRLTNAALGTSGSGKQFFHFQGNRFSHIIDPRTGWPAQGMLSTTVICPSGGVADALATALFVMGPEKSVEFCRQHPEIGALLVFNDARTHQTRIETYNLAEGQWLPHLKQAHYQKD